MNNNKTIIHLSFEILFAILIIFGSYNIFNTNKLTTNAVAYNSNNKNLIFEEINALDLTNIYPIENKDALNIYEPAKIKITNNNTSKFHYRLIYRISSNTMDLNWFNYYINLDNEESINKFINLKTKITSDYTDIIINEEIINENETIYVDYLMWLDYTIGNEAQNKSFIGNFVLETY